MDTVRTIIGNTVRILCYCFAESFELPFPDINQILSLNDKENPPLLVEKKFGRGLVSVFTSSLDVYWNTMPLYGMCVAFWHEMVYKITEVPR